MLSSEDLNPLRFFVYGTLLPGEVNHDLLLLGRTSDEIAASLAGARMWANGDRFTLPGRQWPFPFVALVEDHEQTVVGALVTIDSNHSSQVLRELDDLETYTPGASDNRYERVQVQVRCAHGTVSCWTYVAADRIRDELAALPEIPSGDWLAYLRG